jgi:hypothetical protein
MSTLTQRPEYKGKFYVMNPEPVRTRIWPKSTEMYSVESGSEKKSFLIHKTAGKYRFLFGHCDNNFLFQRINPKQYEDAFVCAPDGASDIYIKVWIKAYCPAILFKFVY